MNKKFILCIALTGIISQANAQQKEKQIEEVTIASKVSQKINKTGRNITLLTQKDLEKYKGQTLSEVLEHVSGFQITGNYNNDSHPKTLRVRGGNNNNVVILVDGVPLQNVTATGGTLVDIRLLSLENIDSIEVLNGASAVLYGSNATTAVIDIKTKKYSQKEISAILGARIGSYDTFAQKFDISGKSNVFSYQISGANEKSSGISAAQGDSSFDKDGFEKQNISVKLGVDLKKFNFNILGGFNHHLYAYDYGAFIDGQQRGNDTQTYVGFNANYIYNIGKLTFNTRYTELERIYEDFKVSDYQETSVYEGANSFTEFYNTLKIENWVNLVTGIQYEDHRLGTRNSGANLLDKQEAKISHIDAFANANFNYKLFYLDAGVRMTDHSKFGTYWVYNINPYLYQEFGNWFGKAGYIIGTAFIAPTLHQIYGDGQWTKPNFNLKPETNLSQEINLSFGKQDRTFVLNASLFQREEKNSINYVFTASKYENIDTERIRVKGFEAGFDYQIISAIRLGGNFSFVEKNNEKAMAYQPKQRINSYLDLSLFKGNNIHISHSFVAKRGRSIYDNPNYSMDNFNIFNIGINQKINKNLSTYFQLNNALNKHYIDIIGYTTKNRNFIFGIDYKF